MAGLESLTSHIYHEQQQAGSMLCAQHALNTLLQGNYFTPADLSAIAASLDELERRYDTEGAPTQSQNMDDTGFFSIQVLQNALNIWGLRLVHWRSEEMKAYQDRPYAQRGFILNLEQHWFTLRRFGQAVSAKEATEAEAERSHWFNLNSFLPRPEWVGRLYLGMVLQQAEEEGYSVYVVAQIDDSGESILGGTEADDIAPLLPQPRSASTTTQMTTRTLSGETSKGTSRPQAEGFEDEDMELQAALQASLGGGEYSPFNAPEPVSTTATNPNPLAEAESSIEASRARSRAIMERMRREQEAALRNTYDEEIEERFYGQQDSSHIRFEGLPMDEDDENTNPSRAGIQASTARLVRGARQGTDSVLQRALRASQEDEEEDTGRRVRQRRQATPPLPVPDAAADSFGQQTGVYDDDDAELQAALQASLAHIPAGFTIPIDQPPPSRAPDSRPAEPEATPTGSDLSSLSSLATTASTSIGDDDESEIESQAPAPSVDVDEMRKRRLARFGG
ncbi:Josephin-domain-containing protein [Sistotremastrum niveocremeum HHB9708]|uniref:ubiquitinyl hydrolase 1 n=2 Tax=Sistotremastraceae TaxID=3402574 RepID=A0A165AAC3_9AGAM|nr:Josephin-domain-containing protein [Sistotremastrum niveocremeum HHB9708]KZT42473.1 Josephin-domain-containing protein [Sistotremastrum suecicum HHB10207 ss-3]